MVCPEATVLISIVTANYSRFCVSRRFRIAASRSCRAPPSTPAASRRRLGGADRRPPEDGRLSDEHPNKHLRIGGPTNVFEVPHCYRHTRVGSKPVAVVQLHRGSNGSGLGANGYGDQRQWNLPWIR